VVVGGDPIVVVLLLEARRTSNWVMWLDPPKVVVKISIFSGYVVVAVVAARRSSSGSVGSGGCPLSRWWRWNRASRRSSGLERKIELARRLGMAPRQVAPLFQNGRLIRGGPIFSVSNGDDDDHGMNTAENHG
jgi:hypothetical protein